MKNQVVHLDDGNTVIYTPYKGKIVKVLVTTSSLHKIDMPEITWGVIEVPQGKGRSSSCYVRGFTEGNKTMYMHRILTGASKGQVVDHLNHLTWDNRDSNLRIVTTSENALNRRGANKGSKSHCRGVTKWKKGWVGSIRVNGSTHRQFFKTKDDAVEYVKVTLKDAGYDNVELGHRKVPKPRRYAKTIDNQPLTLAAERGLRESNEEVLGKD